MPGIARVLDVANTGSGGLVVSGGSVAARWRSGRHSPSPIGGARAIQSLAAAEAAHRSGVALSIDHPSRVRVISRATWRSPSPRCPIATPEDDIRGIGAALYALLIDRWPLPESGAAGWHPPTSTPPASPSSPGRSTAISVPDFGGRGRAVQDGGGIRTAPTLLNLLQQATAIADRTQLISPVDQPEVPAPPPSFRAAADPEAAARRRRG